jgi:hypothetical protein
LTPAYGSTSLRKLSGIPATNPTALSHRRQYMNGARNLDREGPLLAESSSLSLTLTEADARRSSAEHASSDFLSYDPYGLMYRKDDPQFAQAVERTFRRLAESRERVWI